MKRLLWELVALASMALFALWRIGRYEREATDFKIVVAQRQRLRRGIWVALGRRIFPGVQVRFLLLSDDRVVTFRERLEREVRERYNMPPGHDLPEEDQVLVNRQTIIRCVVALRGTILNLPGGDRLMNGSEPPEVARKVFGKLIGDDHRVMLKMVRILRHLELLPVTPIDDLGELHAERIAR